MLYGNDLYIQIMYFYSSSYRANLLVTWPLEGMKESGACENLVDKNYNSLT